jgi:hypothetical protein
MKRYETMTVYYRYFENARTNVARYDKYMKRIEYWTNEKKDE